MVNTSSTSEYILRQEQKQSELIAALAESVDINAERLARNLSRCQESRAKRRKWGSKDIRRIMSNESRYHCKHIACLFCRDGITEKRAKKEAQRFDHADPRFCTFATIADSMHGSLAPLRDHVQQITRSLRYLRDAAADMWPLWGRVEMIGYAEPDPVWIYGIEFLAPDQNALISRFREKKVLPEEEVFWVLRAHIRIRHEGIGRGELHEVLSRRWPDEGQVHLQEFDPSEIASESAGKLGCYSTKHQHKMTSGWITHEWPMSCQVQYYTWLQSMGRGIQPLRLSVGPQKTKTRAESFFDPSSDHEQDDDSDLWLEPMPVLV